MKASLFICLMIWFVPLTRGQIALSKLERSYWVHASLATSPKQGYWGLKFAGSAKPTAAEVKNAAKLLTGTYGANRLYLIYHNEISIADAEEVFGVWRNHCPREVEIVPTLVLRAYDKENTEVFSSDELMRLAIFFREKINPLHVAVYDVYRGRDQGSGVDALARVFPKGLLRVGLQPGEPISSPFVGAVEDTWSGFCHGKTNDDWLQPGFGAQTLRGWINERNAGVKPVAWDLITVAWDYSVTKRGEYPGYDDAAKNMPLPAGRNRQAVQEVMRLAKPEVLAGFSCDLFILHVNSRHNAHDGPGGAFYETLKRGEVYRGYYRTSFEEVVSGFRALKESRIAPS